MAGGMIAIVALWTMLSSDPNAVYMQDDLPYEQLYASCEGKGGRACCRASVHAMKEQRVMPVSVKQGCREGERIASLPCPASLTWCEPEEKAAGYSRPGAGQSR